MSKIVPLTVILSITLFCSGAILTNPNERSTLSRNRRQLMSSNSTNSTIPGECAMRAACQRRNCLSYYCNVGDDCLMVSSKPFCVNATMGPYDAMVCSEERCANCPMGAHVCAGTECADMQLNPALAPCDFFSVRGPIRFA